MFVCPFCKKELRSVMTEEVESTKSKHLYKFNGETYSWDTELLEDHDNEVTIEKILCPYCKKELPKELASQIEELLEW